ncbi:hypothetical protein BHM03_00033933 [Ensete ventricosum]|nr:hypothetical protein BHM03_00033933 [Ensete ventricosum]
MSPVAVVEMPVLLSFFFPHSRHHFGRCSSPSPPAAHVTTAAIAAAFFSACTNNVAAPLLLAAAAFSLAYFLPCILLCYCRQRLIPPSPQPLLSPHLPSPAAPLLYVHHSLDILIASLQPPPFITLLPLLPSISRSQSPPLILLLPLLPSTSRS